MLYAACDKSQISRNIDLIINSSIATCAKYDVEQYPGMHSCPGEDTFSLESFRSHCWQ